MACCLVIALLISWVREAWFRLFPARRPDRARFAPPARRPMPGARSEPADALPGREPEPTRSRPGREPVPARRVAA